jgi:hypothetical protein
MDEKEALKIAQELADAGINVNAWFDVQGGEVRIQSLDNQKELLTQMRDMLQSQVNAHVEQLDEAMAQLNRAEQGGGH